MREPLMRACSSTQTQVGRCGMESYEDGSEPLCWYHRKYADLRLVGKTTTLHLAG